MLCRRFYKSLFAGLTARGQVIPVLKEEEKEINERGRRYKKEINVNAT
jgi:hypothetical protein